MGVGVQPSAPLRCCSATVHPQPGFPRLHPGFWVFGLPPRAAIVPLTAAPAPGVTRRAAPACLGHPWVPGEGTTWPRTGNDLVLYWCSLSVPRRGGFAAGCVRARLVAHMHGRLHGCGERCKASRRWVVGAATPAPTYCRGCSTGGSSPRPLGCELCGDSDPPRCFRSCSPSSAPPGAFPLAFLLLFKCQFVAAL